MCFENAEWHSDMYTPLHVINDSVEISLETLSNASSFFLFEALKEPEILGIALLRLKITNNNGAFNAVFAAVEEQQELNFRHLPENFLCMFSLVSAEVKILEL